MEPPNLNAPTNEVSVPDNKGALLNNIIISSETQNQNNTLQIEEHIQLNKFNETTGDTIHRLVIHLFEKIKFSILPFCSKHPRPKEALEWDLWGPFIYLSIIGICSNYSFSNSGNSIAITLFNSVFASIFCSVFKIFFIGGFFIYLNIYYLGGKLSIFQVYSCLGYSMYLLALLVAMFSTSVHLSYNNKFLALIGGCLWSSIVFMFFIKKMVPENKEGMAMFPSLILYISIAFLSIDSMKLQTSII